MTKPDLSRQSIIPSGSTASFDGSISIGEKLLVQDVEFVVSGITSGQTLVYNSTLNKLVPTTIVLDASSTLADMTDVNFTALTSGDTIVFNSATNKWENNNITLDTDSVINTSTVTGSTTTNALDNLNTNKADLTDLYKLTNDFEAVTTSITLEASKMYVVFPLTTDILLTLPAHGINDTNTVIVIHKVDSANIVTVAGYGVTTYLTDADDSVIYISNGSVWIPFSWRNNASANAYSDSLITQTITNGVTDKSPSEDAVYDVLVNKADLVAGKVPTSQLPSYVDDVIEGYYYTSIFYEDSGHTITITGETSKIYIDLPTNLTYRWSGSVYIEISSTTLLGTTNRITVTGSTIDIASTYTGQTSIDTIGGITTGSWSGTPINDTYISSASTWNAKQNQLNGNGFVRTTGTTIDYLSGTTNQFVKADGSLDSNTYTAAYAIPNYYRVDLNNGSDITGVAGREDKPYKLIQTVWDLITTGSTSQITIEIVGDYTFTTHALLTSVSKSNITFLFKGKIVYAVPASPASRPLFTFSQTNNNITFIVPNYTQTTQGGFIYAPTATVNGYRFIIDSMQVLMGVSTSTVNNWGFSTASPTNESYFQCNSLTISITGDGSGLKGYSFIMGIGKCNYKITTLKVTGTASVASTTPFIFIGIIKSLSIENLITDNSYTNLTQFGISYILQCDNVFVNNINIASDGATQKTSSFSLFSISACKNLTIMSGSILNFGMITYSTTELENLNLGELSMNGVITDRTQLYSKNINLLGNITKTVASQSTYPMINLNPGAVINGNGFKITHADPTYIAIGCIIRVYGNNASPKTSFINNLTIYNSNIATGSTQAFVPIIYGNAETNTLRFRNLVVSANLDNNSHAETSFIRYSGTSTTFTCRIEGNVATNYVKNFTNLTNDCDIDLINGYTL